MNCGGTDVIGSSGPLSEVDSIQKNGNTVMTAIAVSRAYQPTVEASRRGRIVRGSRRASETIGATSTRSANEPLIPRPARARGSGR